MITLKRTLAYLLLLAITACKTEVITIPVNYDSPKISTLMATLKGDNTLTLNAQIEQLNDIEIIDHGFLFQKQIKGDTYGNELILSKGKTVVPGTVSLDHVLNTPALPGDKYRYYFYLKTKKGYYKGAAQYIEVNHLSTIEVVKQRAAMGDEITVKGDFSKIKDQYLISWGEFTATVPYSISPNKDQLTFKVPITNKFHHGNKVSFVLKPKVPASTSYNKEIAELQILGTIDPPTRKRYNYKDELLLTGYGLPPAEAEGLFILLNDIKVPYKASIKLADIPNMQLKSFKLGYINGRDEIRYDDEIFFNHPDPNKIKLDKSIVHPRTNLTVSGYEFEYVKKDNHSLGKYPIYVHMKHFDQYQFPLYDFEPGIYTYKYESEFYTVESPQTLEIRKLLVETPAKKDYYAGEKLTIRGNFIKGNQYYVRDKNNEFFTQTPTCTTEGLITYEIPAHVTGKLEVEVGYISISGQYYPHTFTLNSLGHTVDSFFPTKGYAGELLTIKGKGLHLASHIKFGTVDVHFMHRKQDEITFPVPILLNKGNTKMILYMHDKPFEINGDFELL